MSAISSISSAYPVSSTQISQPPAPKPAQQKAAPPEDTVHLSDAAKAAALGDVDNDGDSH